MKASYAAGNYNMNGMVTTKAGQETAESISRDRKPLSTDVRGSQTQGRKGCAGSEIESA